MRSRTLTDRFAVSEVGFGAAGVSNLYSAISDEQAAATIETAWAGGIRYFDVAPHYGLGLAERRLGAALAGTPREEYVVSTKVGRLLVPRTPPLPHDPDLFDVPGDKRRVWDFSLAGIRRSIEDSLARMGIGHIDVAYLHDPDVSEVPGALADGLTALLTLREEGVVGAVGVGTNDSPTAARAFAEYDIDTCMLAGQYTLLRNDGFEAVLRAAAGRPVVLAGVFNSGILATDDVPERATFDYLPASEQILDKARTLARLAHQHRTTLPALAVQHGLRRPGVGSVVLGMRSPQEVRANLAHWAADISPVTWQAIDEEGQP